MLQRHLLKASLPGSPPLASPVSLVSKQLLMRFILTRCSTQKRWKPSPALNRYLLVQGAHTFGVPAKCVLCNTILTQCTNACLPMFSEHLVVSDEMVIHLCLSKKSSTEGAASSQSVPRLNTCTHSLPASSSNAANTTYCNQFYGSPKEDARALPGETGVRAISSTACVSISVQIVQLCFCSHAQCMS